MTLHTITICVMVGAALIAGGIGIYDIIPATRGPKGDTISEITLPWWQKRPIVPLLLGVALGILAGHLGWPQGCG